MRKTGGKTGKMMTSPRNGAQTPTGNHPGNTGGKPGRSGRPRKLWKDFLAELRQNPEVQEALERAAKNENSKGFKPALGVMERYDPERPAVKLEHSGAVTLNLANKLDQADKRLNARR